MVMVNGINLNGIDLYSSVGGSQIASIAASQINSGMSVSNHYVSPGRYDELIDNEKMLNALIDAGVEEWSGYNEAILNYLDGNE